jgi:hypothetical protein
MKNQDAALDPRPVCSTRPKASELAPNPNRLTSGMRFFRNGHWWEIDGYIKGQNAGYYRCKPACFVESRFYTELEIKQSLEEEAVTMQQKSQECSNRGTGRLLIEPIQNGTSLSRYSPKMQGHYSNHTTSYSGKKEPLKVLLVGSRQAVKKAIQTFHLSGFAKLNDWSAFQNRSNSNEVLSILVQRI